MPRHALATLAVLVTALAACVTADGVVSPPAPDAPSFGRTGTTSDPTATFLFPLDDADLGLRSDRLYQSGDFSVYANGECGVAGTIFATTERSNSGDATLQVQANATGKGKCGRRHTIHYRDTDNVLVDVDTVAVFMNVNKVQNTGDYLIPVTTTQERGLNLADTRCGGLRWKPLLNDGTETGADNVLVTRVSADTWRVESKPYPYDKAFCVADGAVYHIPVRFTIVASRALPTS